MPLPHIQVASLAATLTLLATERAVILTRKSCFDYGWSTYHFWHNLGSVTQ